MPATTDAFAQSNFEIEVSTDGSSWVDLCGQATNVDPGDPEHMVGEQMVACSDYAIISPSNKIGPREITVSVVYTETAAEGFETVYDRFVGADKSLYLRWSPAGGANGDKQFTTSDAAGSAAAPGYITSCTIPTQDASTADPALFTFTVKASSVIVADIS